MSKDYDVRDFDADVIRRSHHVPVLVDFWAEWCGPCTVLGPILERLAAEGNGRWVLAKVDTETHREVAAQFGIQGIPNVKLFVDGRVAGEFTGALPEYAVRQWLNKVLPEPFHEEIGRAEEEIRTGRTRQGQKILEDILGREPDHEHARVLLARTRLSAAPENALELVRSIEEHSDYFPLAEAIGTIGALLKKGEHPEGLPEDRIRPLYQEALEALIASDFDRAVEKFLGVIRENRAYDDDGSRKACIAIFRILGEEHDTTRKYRREFGSALNR